MPVAHQNVFLSMPRIYRSFVSVEGLGPALSPLSELGMATDPTESPPSAGPPMATRTRLRHDCHLEDNALFRRRSVVLR